jgi:hypothetical protein
MKINITNIGLSLNSELKKDENEMFGYGYYFLYRAQNEFRNIEGEAIRYEIHEKNTGLSGNEVIYIR